ncbi:ABC transporter ATP-binding protein [Citricoccus sp. SGAir0253]|uniref:dipeptide ABC transporter ATP-binding protein n=1 Tax=Citricoccus sp. SGAir0253 TaxID=2567881 RepID=UPI0010CCCBF9|nr:ABC transporter ATP-binding protein [Citricoccus sp. SGAir0253]QCU78765.1 ABC transporter ATP-binding protein [Citricoccus sp. SGAir0253]
MTQPTESTPEDTRPAPPAPTVTAPAGTAAAARVRNLSVAFGDRRHAVPTVHGVDLEIQPGECLAIVGESGSGKSVTARSLIGLTGDNALVSADALEVGGVDQLANGPRQWRRVRGAEVGYVLQDALVSLDPLRPIGREIDDALRLHTRLDRSQRRAKVLQLLDDVGIPDPGQRLHQRSGELSGGLRQRALIATAIALDPPLLVADEPTTALDATVQRQILDLLARLKDQGTALLLISHDLAVVGDLADRIAVMQAGRIVETGPSAEILADPQHPYTRRLLRAVPTGRPRGTALSESPVATSDRQHRLIASRRGLEPVATDEAAATEPLLVGTGLRKAFRNPDRSERVAVDDVSFSLARGTTLGIVGESGSGKSTIARMALGLTRPDAGTVRFRGQDWSAMTERERRPHRRRIASIYQDPLGSFDPQWSVEQVLADALIDGGALSGADRRDEVVQLLETVGLGADHLRRRPARLSGGQRQRVAIARALASGPEVIVCDEPVSALDVSIQAQVLDLLDELQRQFGLSYLFISHDLGVVQHVSDEIVVMRQGRVVEAGRAHQVFARPSHPYTQALLDAAPRLSVSTGGAA